MLFRKKYGFSIKSKIEGNQLSVVLSGPFMFDSHKEFKQAILPYIATGCVGLINLDFTEVTRIDSSILGVLLILRDETLRYNIKLTMSGIPTPVLMTFKGARFDRLFELM